MIASNSSLQNGDFAFCVSFKLFEDIELTVIQYSSVIYWPEQMPILVLQELNLTFGAKGTTIVEINECESRAIVTAHPDYSKMGSSMSNLKQVRGSFFSLHYIYYEGPVFLTVKSRKGSVRWINYDPRERRGIGYQEFEIRNLVVVKLSEFLLDVVVFQPTSEMPELNRRVKEIEYIFSFGVTETDLFSSLNCGTERGAEKVVRVTPSYGSSGKLTQEAQ